LDRHPTVHRHFTPTYSSWLNQVELWFAKIERDVIARGVFTSVPDLRRKLLRYIRQYNKARKTIKWRYRDPTRGITLDSVVTVHSHAHGYKMQASEFVAPLEAVASGSAGHGRRRDRRDDG
jgi:hypothetical protein